MPHDWDDPRTCADLAEEAALEFQNMTDVVANGDAIIELPETKEGKPKSVFAKSLRYWMAKANIGIDKMVELVNARKKVPINRKRIITLRSDGITSIEKARKIEELHEIVAVLKTAIPELTIDHLFEDPENPQNTPMDEMLRRCREGLNGPKRSFLLEAIRYAYTQKVNTEPS